MAETNEGLTVEGRDSVEDQKLKEHIDTTKVFRVLLKLQSINEAVEEHCPEDGIDSNYSFSIVVQHVRDALMCSQEEAVNQLNKYIEEGYVTVLSTDKIVGLKQLLEAGDRYGNMEMCLNEQKMMEFLVNDSAMIGEYIGEMMVSLRQLQRSQSDYESTAESLGQSYQNVENLYNKTKGLVDNWEKT